ncbi:hypothetical protein FE697_015815 [Mumia zhuanghuii]|uniref:DUF6703 family protein n=2 Tax=Mumia TaxID=1546255 RepID=A0ABW1QP71_9ACTN|nr:MULTISPECIES: DUF6703 family protein [Mumia]KAA1420431.1 hypothetical protein FE697_015815 [Mumia zhuanghuii]
MSDSYDRLQASRRARLVIPLLGALLLVAGLAAPAWIGIPALAVLVAFVVWLAQRSPDQTSGLARIRVLVVGILVALLVGRFLTAVLG